MNQPSGLPRVLVKVCGLTDVGEAVACARAGVDWIGLNFHRPSPRWVDPCVASEIVAALPESCVPVGLFVNRPPEEVLDTAGRVGLRVVQLHGDESPEDLVALGRLWVVRAFRLGDEAAVEAMRAYLDRAEELGRAPDAVLVDGYAAGLPGGTGLAVADGLLDRLPPLPRLILAGGLTPENVAGRVVRARPWMVDVASGVESSPGRKDMARVAEFVRRANAGAGGADSS